MNFIQATLQAVEVGRAQVLVRVIPLLAALLIVAGAYNMLIYHGLSDAQSMDNAQLARQLTRGQGFTTEFLRPQAVAQLHDLATAKSLQSGKSAELFPADSYPPGTPRILPDTYNPPGYPLLLSLWFHVVRPEFGQVPTAMSTSHIYSPDRWIPFLNQGFMILTAILVFALGGRLFDDRVAWLSIIAFLGTDLIWHYTLTALSTSVLMFFVTAALMCALEVVCVSEACFENEDRSFLPAIGWALASGLFLAIACLTRLNIVILLIPLFVVLIAMPRASFLSFVLIAVIVIAAIAPWFYHAYKVSGNPLGSNFALVLYGQTGYDGNQIYCSSSIPEYEHLFKDFVSKELTGIRWHLEHAWGLLGANPLILLFAASILHQFKRKRTRIFQWLLYGSALVLVLVNNLGSAKPENIDPWNIVIVLYPCMLVLGSAFFFILLDRLYLQMRLLHNLIVISTVAFILTPMALTLTGDTNVYYAFPPYMPPMIKALGEYSQPDEWITTDMPWATAWYADRPSLWLPDSMADFEDLHKNVCPTGIIMLTPVTWSEPVSTFTSGEYRDWSTLVMGQPLPIDFPLTVHTLTAPGGPDYYLWSDRPRWQTR